MPAQNKKEFIVFHFSRLCRYYLRLAIGVDEDRRVCGNALAIVPLKAVKRRYLREVLIILPYACIDVHCVYFE